MSAELSPPAAADERLPRGRMHLAALAVVTAVAVGACVALTKPFLPAVTWAVALAVVAYPLHRFVVRLVGPGNLAAGVSVTLVLLVIVLPILAVTAALANEVGAAGQMVQEHVADGRWRELVARVPYVGEYLPRLEEHVNPEQTARELVGRLTQDFAGLLSGSAWAGLQALAAVFILFFCFRDRDQLLTGLRDVLPVTRREADLLFGKASDAVHATVSGTLVVGLLQGATGGLLFWWLGLPGALLWGVVMAVLSVLPVVGAFLVWVPAAALLASDDRWGAAAILVGWGVLMAGPVSNYAYAYLAGDRMRLHPVPTLLAFVGGLAVFGLSGMVLGPAVVGVTAGLLEVWKARAVRGDGPALPAAVG